MYTLNNIFFFLLDIDLNDPEVEAAAAKIQSAFKFRMKGKKNWNYFQKFFQNVDSENYRVTSLSLN